MPLPCDPERYRSLLGLQVRQLRYHSGLLDRFIESELVQMTLEHLEQWRCVNPGATEVTLISKMTEMLIDTLGPTNREEATQALDLWKAVLPEPSLPANLAAEKIDLLLALTDALAKLPEDQSDAIVVRHFFGMSHSDASARLEMTPESLMSLLRQGHHQLKNLMSSEKEEPGDENESRPE